ncbi:MULTISPECIES: PapB/FocB family fimbrial expression transcriptional regulator [Hafnia]|uniref:PapB/FocB family fimbrial expression transcriptional regulator n=1 Tax=Hafnia TaxID=568 RepID=UPI00076AFC6A|nr:PapB/FocB family fimbrial expression transcriptional regulator [Hafnia paralvei]AMH16756.1 transcriptional regulator [Hafnia paralvei]MBW2957138.1 adhesin biosynthesis transcription regulatory family protein [Hafnia paralvei]MCQ4169240.1 adhesin biosynthesis transcription regulatory family protein [Hafnia paralvei]MDX6841637.1 PapB/FocB family fimbrial expression transcriptional regulator [Hafnia paralvei]RDA68867.1 transcriptional regulator [Hafnia paralvei]
MNRTHEENDLSAMSKITQGELTPGEVDIRLFRLLSTVCVMHSPSIRQSLEDVLVHGKSRSEACEANGVAQSYFSVKYRHMQMVSRTVARICALIYEEGHTMTGSSLTHIETRK